MAQMPEAFKKVADELQEKLVGEPGSPEGIVKAIHDVLGAPGTGGGQSGAGGLCEEIALAILGPIIIAELTFLGLRIVFKSPFVEQFTSFTRTLFIASILLVWQMPQAAIRMGWEGLTEGGKQLGKEIISASGAEADEDDPIKYWGKWLGNPETDENGKPVDKECKYNVERVMKMFDEKEKPPKATEGLDLTVDGKKFFDIDTDKLEWIKKLAGRGDTSGGGGGGGLSGLWTYMTQELTTERVLAMLMPFMVLSMIVTAVMGQMAGYLAPVFTQLAILIGSQVTLEFGLAVGLTVVPLMFFKTFEKIWAGYLVFCTSLALVPCFYYIMSGLGFAFSTMAFDILFPEEGSRDTLAGLLRDALKGGIASMIPGMFGWFGAAFKSTGLLLFYWFVAVFEKLFFFVGGTMIVTTFVAGGVGFGAIAPSIAGAWNNAFAKDDLLGKINEFFTGVGGSVGSAVGQAYGQSMSSASNVIVGGMKGLFNFGK